VQALPASANPDRILDTLSQIGGSEALAAVVAQFESPAEDRKAATFRALTRWPGTEVTGRLYAIAARGDATYRNQAFSAFVRQVSASPLPIGFTTGSATLVRPPAGR
jgi:hypothetical protein